MTAPHLSSLRGSGRYDKMTMLTTQVPWHWSGSVLHHSKLNQYIPKLWGFSRVHKNVTVTLTVTTRIGHLFERENGHHESDLFHFVIASVINILESYMHGNKFCVRCKFLLPLSETLFPAHVPRNIANLGWIVCNESREKHKENIQQQLMPSLLAG